ncbi:MNIO family bufferin maturase [Candidatus Contendibacter odensensis]|uniref:UPF0276 protein BN874_1740007 n=1 Tax=Candidatus Contendobacter odensis Run_B_J11 TaxID=1400861 RepID=A0A7U7GAG8_9GAMM|nr:DUF692 domain-containing protein [Candidatus Contendobacter odensis]CDH44555.1 conserved hypothetical protein [Candidatus Contendobacter odensis Run_B_J11]
MIAKPVLSVLGPGSIPDRAGIGLRAEHYDAVLETQPPVGWLEVHSENYFGAGGKPLDYLERIRAHYPLSLHGVGLSIGSTDPLNRRHLAALKTLIRRFEPALVSEHLSWGSVGGRHLNDLLPLPYTEEALYHLVARVCQAQEILGRQILIENPSSYLQYMESALPEWEFLAELAQRSGCGILLDVNNIYVSARNHGFDASAYLQAIPRSMVQEIHLAGFMVNRFDDGEILIDTHNQPVCPAVWALYRQAVQRFGRIPTLIEWDTDVPELAVLVAEAERANAILEERHAQAA